MAFDVDAMATQMLDAVKAYVGRTADAVNGRIDALEQRLTEIPAGRDGQPGRDADPQEIAAMLQPELVRLVDAIPRPKDGADGLNGKDGAEGRNGIDGNEGSKGDPGERGEKGADGRDGKDGRDGRDGQDGEPGRDAAAIEPLPAIDAARSYPRGTWAKHAGGLWLARAATDGMTGWDCIVDGVAAIVVSQGDDLRTLSVTSMLSSGTMSATDFTIPAMIYRGVWKRGIEYKHGDTTTRDGSTWHANRDTTAEPGDSSGDWTMSNKRGQNGKDGKDGVRGSDGKEGRPGRDLTQMAFNGAKY